MRGESVPNAIVDMLVKQDAYAKHRSAVSSAKATINTSASPAVPRLEVWRRRVTRERQVKLARERNNIRQVLQGEKQRGKARAAHGTPEGFDEDFVSEDWLEDLPEVEEELEGRAQQPLIAVRPSPRVVKPIEKQAASSKPSVRQGKPLKELPRAERIHFHGKGEIEVNRGSINESGFDDDWEIDADDLASGRSEQAELPGQPSELPTFDASSEEKVEIKKETVMADRTIQEKVESVREPDDVERNGNGAPESPVESAEEQAEARDPEEHEGNQFEMVIQSHANESAPQKPEKEARPESRKRLQIHGKVQEEVDLIGINCVHAKAQSLCLPDIPCEIAISDQLRFDMTSVNCRDSFR
jgi:hypothetical protein